jgi:hypothetical protein
MSKEKARELFGQYLSEEHRALQSFAHTFFQNHPMDEEIKEYFNRYLFGEDFFIEEKDVEVLNPHLLDYLKQLLDLFNDRQLGMVEKRLQELSDKDRNSIRNTLFYLKERSYA